MHLNTQEMFIPSVFSLQGLACSKTTISETHAPTKQSTENPAYWCQGFNTKQTTPKQKNSKQPPSS